MLPATQRGAQACAGTRRDAVQVARRPSAQATPARRRVAASAAQQSNGFLDNVKRVAKSIQGALPIVGLISRLTADEGGFDELAYPEYCRSLINASTAQFKAALAGLESKYGKVANSRWVYLLLWMAKTGTGLVPTKDVMSAAKRLRITQDMEIEIDRFSISRNTTIQKYSMMQVPTGKVTDKVNLALDAICTACIGLKDGQPVSDDDATLLMDILQGAFPEAEPALIRASITSRPQRTGALAGSA